MKKIIRWLAKIFKAEIYEVKFVINGNELINSLKKQIQWQREFT